MFHIDNFNLHFVDEISLSLNGTNVINETLTRKMQFVAGLNKINIGYWWYTYTENTMASIELYLKPFKNNDIKLAMENSRTMALEEDCSIF